MSFQFRFASILQLRRRQRDEAGAAVGQACEAIRRIDEQATAIQRERQGVREGMMDHQTGDVSVDRLLVRGRYDLQLQADIHALDDTRSKLTQELERRRGTLVAAETEVKRFERLEEQERSRHQADLLKREQFEADEATARRYTIERRR